jgi:chromatin segregation and condensation protein Rec8/ScpA/Scc1 (kleisin family)
MAREGRILIRQDRAFAPLWVKRGEAPALAADAGA